MQRRQFLTLGLAAALTAALPLVGDDRSASASGGVHLVMFSSPDCGSCVRFHRQMEPQYRSSSVGARMPLVVRDLSDGVGGYRLKSGIAFTPTFVVVRNGIELSRFVGFEGREAFMRRVTALGNRFAAVPAAPEPEPEARPSRPTGRAI